MNDTGASVPAQALCGHCRRPWFGAVAYCPYCGRKAGAASLQREPAPPAPRPEPVAAERRAVATAAATAGPRFQLTPAPRVEARATSAPQPASPGEDRPFRLGKKGLTLLFGTAVVGATALLYLWMAVVLVAHQGKVEVRASPPEVSSAMPDPTPRATAPPTAATPPRVAAPPTTAAAQPRAAAPPTTAAAAPPAAAPQRAAPQRAAAPPTVAKARPAPQPAAPPAPPTNVLGASPSLCSPADETAGLCRTR